MNTRRRMMMGRKKVFVFKEGEGILLGTAYLQSTYNSEINNNYIELGGRAWGSGTDEDDAAYGMLIGENLVNDNTFMRGTAFDFSDYKTLNFEFAAGSNSGYGYAGYCEEQDVAKHDLSHEGGFSDNRIEDLYKGGEYKTIAGTERQKVSFDISEKSSGIIAMLSPIGNRHVKFYNIWFE